MHVGFLTTEYPTTERPEGGLANYVRSAANGLTERGNHVTVLALAERTGESRDGEVEILWVPRRRFPGTLGRFRSGLEQLANSMRFRAHTWRRHRAAPFDILQTASYQAPGFCLRRNGRIPVVCRASSYTPLCRTAYGLPRTLGTTLCDWLEVRQVIDAEASFAPSLFVAKQFRRIEGCCPEVIRTPVPLALDGDPSFYQAHFEGLPYLLFFGTLSRIKGTDLIVDVLPELLHKHERLHFAFIGRDDGLPSGEKFQDLIRASCPNILDRVHIYGPLPKPDLVPVLTHAVGVVMPSRVDNYPNACLEAMSLGVPIVGTDHSSLEEMIADGETGFLARNGDAKSLLSAVNRLLHLRPSERQKMRLQTEKRMQMAIEEDRLGQLVALYSRLTERQVPAFPPGTVSRND